MTKKLVLNTVFLLTPIAAFAGDGGDLGSSGALLLQAVGRMIAKLTNMF